MSKIPEDNIRKLAKILKEENLSEIEVEIDSAKIKVKNEQQVVASAPIQAQAPTPAQASPGSSEASPDPSLLEVTSPMVGTYYASSSPDAGAFVKIGSKVKSGDTLCIIEAMKLFNELPSEYAGEVAEICVSDGQAVSFGQVLMKIKKD